MDRRLITTGELRSDALAGRIAIVTGGGRGIGFEAARALTGLGARVVIAEIDKAAGKSAASRICAESGAEAALFVHTDVGDEDSVHQLARRAVRAYDKIDIVLNNATVASLGAAHEVPIKAWDTSYRVNLRGPVLLATTFLPAMIERRSGVFACVSSVGQAFMGPYEAIKAAQVHLANTLDAELVGTGVSAFTIGPGFVPTETAKNAIPALAALMGTSLEELQATLTAHTISVEAAGAGFAAAIAMAERYRGQEISSVQALVDAGIDVPEAGTGSAMPQIPADRFEQILAFTERVRATLSDQSASWHERNVFERQWIIRTFRSDARMSAEAWLGALDAMRSAAAAQNAADLVAVEAPLDALAGHYAHLYELAKGYVKDPAQREAELAIVAGWQADVLALSDLIRPR